MKRYIILFFICVCMSCVCSGCNDNEDINYFGGEGELQMVGGYEFPHIYYDDTNIYFSTFYTGLAYIGADNNIYTICDDASCEHDNDKCKAYYISHLYFVLNNELYEAKHIVENDVQKSIIKKVNDTDICFEVALPKDTDVDGKDYNLTINNVYLVNDTYIYVNCGNYVYLLDKEFNVVLWHSNVGKSDWCMVKDDIYYYLNDLYEISIIDMNTKTETVYETEDYVTVLDSDGEYFYYVNENKRLCKMPINGGEREILYKGVSEIYLGSEYIYFSPVSLNKDPAEKCICVMDKSGNIITKIDDKAGYIIREVNGKIIATSSESVLAFDLNGSNLKEYTIER